MRTKFIMLSLSLLSIYFCASSQNKYNIPNNLYKLANTASNVNYLSEDEKEVILYMNIARIDGKWFVKNLLQKYPKSQTEYFRSLKADLIKHSTTHALKPAKGLCNSARYHAKDMGSKGKIGHRSSDGTGAFTRIKQFAKGGSMAENCQYGYSDPLKIVIALLIDEGIPSLGHRINILAKDYYYVGVAIEPHSRYRYNCVQDFSNQGDN